MPANASAFDFGPPSALWMSVEVMDAARSAALWSAGHADALVEAALVSGALDWAWHRNTWGTVFEVQFRDEAGWDRFRAHPSVGTALDAVPDPVWGLLIYSGRGGSLGDIAPRKPRPLVGSGAAALALPTALPSEDWLDAVDALLSTLSAPLTHTRSAVR